MSAGDEITITDITQPNQLKVCQNNSCLLTNTKVFVFLENIFESCCTKSYVICLFIRNICRHLLYRIKKLQSITMTSYAVNIGSQIILITLFLNPVRQL